MADDSESPFLRRTGVVLADAGQVRQDVSAALALCARSVIPALFPFLVVSTLLLRLGFGELAAPWLAGLMEPLFRVDGVGSSALLLGLVGGYPIGPGPRRSCTARVRCAGRGGAAAGVFQQLQPGISHQRPGPGGVRQRPGGHLAVADPPALRAADGTVLSAVSDRSCWAPKCDKVLPFPHGLLLFPRWWNPSGPPVPACYRCAPSCCSSMCWPRPLSAPFFPLGPALVGPRSCFP